MIKFRRFPLFLMLMGLTSSLPLYAADITLFGGIQNPGKITLDSATEAGGSILTDPKKFGVFGFRTSQGTVIGAEHTIAYTPNFIDSDSKALIINSNLIVHAPLEVVRPYVTAGIGAIRATGSGLGSVGTKFAVNYGGGVKTTVVGRLGLGFDVRGYSIPSVDSQTLNVLEVSVGVVVKY